MSDSVRDLLRSVIVRVGVFDLCVITPVAAIWLILGIVDPWVAALVLGGRHLVLVFHLYRLLGPLWRLDGRATAAWTESELLAADLAAQTAYSRLLINYAGGWVAAALLAFSLAALGLPAPIYPGQAELVTGALILLATVVTCSALLHPILHGALLGEQTRIGAELVARRLTSPRPRASIGVNVAAITLAMAFGCFVGVGAVGGWLRVEGVRATLGAELGLQVERQAARLRTGEALDEDVAVLASDELPAVLGPELDVLDEPIAAFDVERGRVVAATHVGEGQWLLVAAEPDEQLAYLIVGVFVIFVFGASPSILASIALARTLSSPINALDEATRQFVTHGRLQDLARIVPLRNDECGRLATNFNAMLDMLEQLAAAAAAVSRGNLGVELGHTGELHEAFRGMLDRLSEVVGQIRMTALELASAAAEIQAMTRQQDDAVREQAAAIDQVGATLESLAAAAQQIAGTAARTFDDAQRSVTTTDEVVGRIAELRAHADTIGAALEAIHEIASRSDLLALNGSLEATRAGEAGRGFALVAAEMRRLAERVTHTVADVRSGMDEIDNSGTRTVAATDRSRALAKSTAEAAREISDVTRKQSDDTQQASQAVRSLAQTVGVTARVAGQTQAAAEGLHLHAIELERLIGQFVVDK